MGLWDIIIPEERSNFVLNPIAMGSGNYTAVGATVTLDTTHAYLGYRNFKVVGTLDNQGITLTLAALANADHYVMVISYGAISNWDWSLNGSNFHAPALLRQEGAWYVYGYQFTASEANGSTSLRLYKNGSASFTWYLGLVQNEPGTGATTPITGDVIGTMVDGYYWNGVPHASTSTRSAFERSGGKLTDLNTLKAYIISSEGIGMPPSYHYKQDQALLPGLLYKGQKTLPRNILLVFDVIGTSLKNLHYQRKLIIDYIKNNSTYGDQPFTLRYRGAVDVPLNVHCVADTGMGYNKPKGYTETVSLRTISYDPFFYAPFQASAILTAMATFTTTYMAKKIKGVWSNVSASLPVGMYNVIRAKDRFLYIGGSFLNLGDANGDKFVKFDPITGTITSCGAGIMNSNGSYPVNCLANAPNGDIFIGGNFTNATANYLLGWDGSSYYMLGSSAPSARVLTMAVGQDGSLVIGGDMVTVGGVTVNRIGWYSAGDLIPTWHAFGTGTTTSVLNVKIAPNGDVIACGAFPTMGGVTVNGIARWGTGDAVPAWHAYGSGMNGTVADILVDKAGYVYAIGNFTQAGGVACNYIARWTGSGWEPVGGGLNAEGFKLAMGANGLIYVMGSFTLAGGLSVRGLAIWNGHSWTKPDYYPPNSWLAAQIDILEGADDIYLLVKSSGSSSGSAKNTITNNGSADAYPKIVFGRDATGTYCELLYIKNYTTGDTLMFNYNIIKNETITIDFTPNKPSIKSSVFGDVWRALLRGSNFGTFRLVPGVNEIGVYVRNDVTALTAYMNWDETYISVDGGATS